MKKILLPFFTFFSLLASAQQTINDTITHDGLQRNFILYVPATYSASNPTPLVFNFHGYGSNAAQQVFYSNFNAVADTAGFILVYPNGTLDNTNTAYWNAGWGGTVDDIDFTSALIDSLAEDYNINLERVYSTGMSNGGFMSYTLACELSNEISAIASVTGTMSSAQALSCNPQRSVPIMEIHGTADGTVPYTGNQTTFEPIPEVLDYWVDFNQCDTSASFIAVPNSNTSDGCTAEHYVYTNSNTGIEVEHYKIINGGHTWPGAPFDIGVTNRDINASVEIWRFFNQYDINGRRIPLGTDDLGFSKLKLKAFPNPSSGDFMIDFGHSNALVEIIIRTALGQVISKASYYPSGKFALHIEGPAGLYFAEVKQFSQRKTLKLIKQ